MEHDKEIAALIEALKDELKLEIHGDLISKATVLEALLPKKPEKSFLDPALSFIKLVQDVSSHRMQVRDEHAQKLRSINSDIELLNNLMGHFQNATSDLKIDFSSNNEVCAMIDEVTHRFGFPKSHTPYVFENKNDVVAFLNHKVQSLTHQTSEHTLYLQNEADLIKTLTDLGMKSNEEDSKLKGTFVKNQS